MRERKSCIPSGVRSPAASASCQPFLRPKGASSPRRWADARRRGSTRPNLGASRATTSSRPRAHPSASLTSVMPGTSYRAERPNRGCSTRANRVKVGTSVAISRTEVVMAGAYSTDLRERVLAAVEAGATPEAAARRYAVGRSTAYRRATAAREEGRRGAKRMGGGPKPRITGEAEAALLGLLGEANHLTLAECRDRVAERTGVGVHPWTVGRALRRRGWT